MPSRFCMQTDGLGQFCYLQKDHREPDHNFQTPADRLNEISKNVDAQMGTLQKILQLKQAATPQPQIQDNYKLAAEFVNYTCRKLAANDRKTWDKPAMYQFFRAQFSAFLTDHVMSIAGGKKNDS